MAARAEYVTPDIATDLRPFVDSVHGYDMTGFPAGEHVGLPSPTITFIIALDEGVDIQRMPRRDRAPARFTALVGGLHDGPVGIAHDGSQAGIQVGLAARAARSLLGVPAAAVTSEVIDLADLWGQATAAELVERVTDAADWHARLSVVAETFRRRLSQHGRHPTEPALDAAWTMLTDAMHVRPVADVAAQVGWSRRNLNDRITREFGLSPVVARSMARFDRARHLVGQGRGSLAEAAAISGYADQSHMTREWKRFTGLSPSGWLAMEEFPSVQADAVAGG